MRKWIFLALLILGPVLNAAASTTDSDILTAEQKLKIKNRVQAYYLNQIFENSGKLFRIDSLNEGSISCDPDQSFGPSCITILCAETSCYGSTGKEIAEACRGANGRCVQELCKDTSCYGSTGKEIAQACRGSSGLCVEVLCKETSCYGSTGKEIAQACEGSDGQCVQELCKHTSCYGSTGREIAQTCAGN